jgi:hypothetical protein
MMSSTRTVIDRIRLTSEGTSSVGPSLARTWKIMAAIAAATPTAA